MLGFKAAGVIATFKEPFSQDEVSAGIKASIWHLSHIMIILTKADLTVGCFCKTTPARLFILLTPVCDLKSALNSCWNASRSAPLMLLEYCKVLHMARQRLFAIVHFCCTFNTLMFAAVSCLMFSSHRQGEKDCSGICLEMLLSSPKSLQLPGVSL